MSSLVHSAEAVPTLPHSNLPKPAQRNWGRQGNLTAHDTQSETVPWATVSEPTLQQHPWKTWEELAARQNTRQRFP